MPQTRAAQAPVDGAPPRVTSLFDLGRSLLEQGCYSDAVRAFSRRLRLLPADREARYLLGVASLHCGDAESAISAFRHVAGPRRGAPTPMAAAAGYALGVALLRQGDADQARSWLAWAQAAPPTCSMAQARLAELDALAEGTDGQAPPAAQGRRRWALRRERP